MAQSLPYGIPATELIQDSYTSQVCTAIRANVMQLYGAIGPSSGRAALISDLTTAGIATVSKTGVLTAGSGTSTGTSTTTNGTTVSSANGVGEFCFKFDATIPTGGTVGCPVGSYYYGQLPAGARVAYAWLDILTAFTGGAGAKIGIGIETDDTYGIMGLGVLSGSYVVLGPKATNQNGLVINFSNKTTDKRSIVVTVDGADLTDGVMNVFIRYYTSL